MPQTGTWPPGFAIHPRVSALRADIIAGFRGAAAANVGDCVGRNLGATGLRSYHNDLSLTFAGPAITVRVRPGDNLMIHQAIAMAEPGDVILVDGGGDTTQALIGGLMRTSALARGIAAFVIDGAVRDVAEWAEGIVACYARGHTHRGPTKDGPGQVNVPIACAGMAVMPGDLVIGDADGVIVVPASEAGDALPRLRAHQVKESQIREDNRSGQTDPERFNMLLRAKGCPV